MCAEAGMYGEIDILIRMLADKQSALEEFLPIMANQVALFAEKIKEYAENPKHPEKKLDELKRMKEQIFVLHEPKMLTEEGLKQAKKECYALLNVMLAKAEQGNQEEVDRLAKEEVDPRDEIIAMANKEEAFLFDLAKNKIKGIFFEYTRPGEKEKSKREAIKCLKNLKKMLEEQGII